MRVLGGRGARMADHSSRFGLGQGTSLFRRRICELSRVTEPLRQASQTDSATVRPRVDAVQIMALFLQQSLKDRPSLGL